VSFVVAIMLLDFRLLGGFVVLLSNVMV